MSSITTIKPLPTLKGVFSVPKINYRRDFLRENKLSLRELQRSTHKKQEEQQLKLLKQQPFNPQLQAQRRSASHSRVSSDGSHRTNGGTPTRQPSRDNLQRSNSEQRNAVPLNKQSNASLVSGGGRSVAGSVTASQRSGARVSYPQTNAHTNKSRASLATEERMRGRIACDKEIQTEDILDEQFLYEALKKCSGKDFGHKPLMPASYAAESRHALAQYNQDHERFKQQETTQGMVDMNEHEDDIEPDAASLSPSLCTVRSYHKEHKLQKQQQVDNAYDAEHSHQNWGPLEAMPMTAGREEQELYGAGANNMAEPPDSVRSRQSMRSMHSQATLKSNASSMQQHTLGSRENVKLPRYLEREKREKEVERKLEAERDPNCPPGHTPLKEEERQGFLRDAETKFHQLVSELNHMPITSDSHRVKKRKDEIEKELVALEQEIRMYSKQKESKSKVANEKKKTKKKHNRNEDQM